MCFWGANDLNNEFIQAIFGPQSNVLLTSIYLVPNFQNIFLLKILWAFEWCWTPMFIQILDLPNLDHLSQAVFLWVFVNPFDLV